MRNILMQIFRNPAAHFHIALVRNVFYPVNHSVSENSVTNQIYSLKIFWHHYLHPPCGPTTVVTLHGKHLSWPRSQRAKLCCLVGLSILVTCQHQLSLEDGMATLLWTTGNTVKRVIEWLKTECCAISSYRIQWDVCFSVSQFTIPQVFKPIIISVMILQFHTLWITAHCWVPG